MAPGASCDTQVTNSNDRLQSDDEAGGDGGGGGGGGNQENLLPPTRSPPPRISGQLRKRHGCPPPRVQEGVIMQPRRVEQERGGEEVAEKAVRKE